MGGFGSPSGKNRSLEPERITRPPSRPLPDREIPAVRLYGVGKFWPKSFYNLDYKREDRAVAEHDFVALRKRKMRINPSVDSWKDNVKRLITHDSCVWDVCQHSFMRYDSRKRCWVLRFRQTRHPAIPVHLQSNRGMPFTVKFADSDFFEAGVGHWNVDGSPPTEGWVGKGIFTGILLHGQYEDPALPGIPWRSQRPPDKDVALEMVYQEDARANIFKFYAEDQGHSLQLAYVPFNMSKGHLGEKETGKNAKFKDLAKRGLEQSRRAKRENTDDDEDRRAAAEMFAVKPKSKACVIC